mmetsp:Transcript_3202/g.8201  ORF Transcript_3202/g.8201 Transcript_3202/m.8201 type:complete len:203 (+) Transcript_3202:21-629(+)
MGLHTNAVVVMLLSRCRVVVWLELCIGRHGSIHRSISSRRKHDENGGHVIAPDAFMGSWVARTDDFCEEFVDDVRGRTARREVLELFAAKVHGLLTRHAVPDTIAGDKDKLILGGQLHCANIGVRCHRLLCQLHFDILFEVDVTNSPRNGQHAVHSLPLDNTARLANPSKFTGVVRFVVLRKIHGDTISAQHRPRITSVGTS